MLHNHHVTLHWHKCDLKKGAHLLMTHYHKKFLAPTWHLEIQMITVWWVNFHMNYGKSSINESVNRRGEGGTMTWFPTTETSDGWGSVPWLLWSSWESVDEVWWDSLWRLGHLFIPPDVAGLLSSVADTETLPPRALWCLDLSANKTTKY